MLRRKLPGGDRAEAAGQQKEVKNYDEKKCKKNYGKKDEWGERDEATGQQKGVKSAEHYVKNDNNKNENDDEN